jgi:para-aminobenzoate synthetase component 1
MSLSQITQLFSRFSFDSAKFQKLSLDYHPLLAQELFSKVHHKPWSMLLSSAGAVHPDSRYDIVVFDPIASVSSQGTVNVIGSSDSSITIKAAPFKVLREIERCLPNWAELEPSLPFCGGILGLWGYELGKTIEHVAVSTINDISVPDMAVGVFTWAIVIDHKTKTASAVGLDAKARYAQLKASTQPDPTPFSLVGSWQSNMDKTSYIERFNKVKKYIYAGDCYQINLAQRFQATYQGCEWRAFQKLENSNKGPFSAFLRLEDSAIISVSPERFIRLDGDEMQTKPIKGTRPRGDTPTQDKDNAVALANAEKDQAENLMIVDLLRNDFGRVATPGSVHVPILFDVESFPAVHHLVSTVEAKLAPNKSASELLEACFPGGSITGAPKVRAMQIIEELEPHTRNAYCGSIGYISNNNKMDTNIAIRTLVAQNETLYAWAGGGLVVDSQADAEYQETLDKLAKILPTLN